MASTSGSLANSTVASADLGKELTAYDVVIPAATNTAQVINPTAPFDAATVYNKSALYDVRGTVTFVATVTSATTAAERCFVVPPLSVFSFDFSDELNDDATGSSGAIDSISFVALNAPAGTGLSSARVAPATLTAAVVVQVNFLQG